VQIQEIDVKSVMTKSNLPVADYSVNPYVGCAHGCKYCYASFMKRFTNHPEPWGSFVDVKYWPEIRKPEKYAGKEAFIGSVTDPYQPCEAKYRRTRAFLEQLQGSGISVSIATKSDLVLRDLDLIKTFPNARVSWSINTLDERYRGIYMRNDRSYRGALDAEMEELFAAAEGFPYVCDDDSKRSPFGELPIVVNYFFHEEIIPSAKKKKEK